VLLRDPTTRQFKNKAAHHIWEKEIVAPFTELSSPVLPKLIFLKYHKQKEASWYFML